nr:immunoglobulin heavy chain junction region [Macaca mulatta]MOV38484.1 immunoglobulin heavy chain junction region [Macaca mulatta]MOV38834.1 immunoglobulin heavy chain junction region [Macaca mulatta]MOV39021.1 immunoglobulin heavy chain junction region [Macaca mulatta]MOV39265.1 immunoglobulin heavy chain junction region [Macaca mulatta]
CARDPKYSYYFGYFDYW